MRILTQRARRIGMVLCLLGLLLLLTGGATLPFLFESKTMLYKFGLDKSLLRTGKIAGIAAVILFTFQVLASSRIPLMDRIFGLDRLFRIHRINGLILLGLMLVHLLFILVPEGIDNLPIGKKYIPEMTGMLIVLLMLPLVLFALKRSWFHLPYHIWLPLHRLVGFLVAPLVFTHVYLVSDPFESGIPFAALTLILTPLPLLACRRIISSFFPAWDWQVDQITSHSPTLHTLRLSSVQNRVLDFLPGQFVFIRFDSPHMGREDHPFSISSAPADGDKPTLTIKSCGDWTNKVPDIAAGTPVSLSVPYGHFSYLLDSSPPGLLLVAGGIGITPLISMLCHLAGENKNLPVHLIWTYRDQSDCMYMDTLNLLKQRMPKFRVTLNCTNPGQGGRRLTAGDLQSVAASLPEGSIAYLCGPGTMVKEIRRSLVQHGFSPGNIHHEYFSL